MTQLELIYPMAAMVLLTTIVLCRTVPAAMWLWLVYGVATAP